MTGLQLKLLRIENGLTQEDVAKLLFVSKRSVVNYEKANYVPPSKVELLKKALKIEEKKIDDRLEHIESLVELLNKGIATMGFNLDQFRDECCEKIDALSEKIKN